MPDPVNPYLPSGLDRLSTMLMALGSGISGAESRGQSGWAGIGPAAAMYGQANQQANQQAIEWQQQQAMMGYRERAMRLQEEEHRDKQAQRDLQLKGIGAWANANDPRSVPGFGPQSPTPTIGPGGDILGRAGGAIAGIESGGQANPYAAIGPQTPQGRANGKYQVMDFNVGPWTQEITGQAMTPEQFRASPEAQEAVFKGKFGQYLQQYGNPQDAASMWFSGKPLAGNTAGPDVNGTTVPAYVSKFNRGMYGGAPPTTDTSFNPVVPTRGAAPAQVAPGAAPGGMPVTRVADQGLPKLEDVPRPSLPPELATYLTGAVRSGALTPAQAESEKQRVIGEIWSAKRAEATTRYQQGVDLYKFQRGQETEGEWVRGADGQERFVSKAQRAPGMTRTDKAPEPGTPSGDVHVLDKRDVTSPDYATAYARAAEPKLTASGQLMYPDMSAYPKPVGGTPAASGGPRVEDTPQARFTMEGKLADDFNQIKTVRDYREVAPIVASMRDAVTRNNRVADLNLIYGLAKLMDPTSVVREGEQIMVRNAQGLPDWVKGMISAYQGGSQFPPEQRKRIMEEAESRVTAYREQYDNVAAQFGEKARAYGLNPKNVITAPFEKAKEEKPAETTDRVRKYNPATGKLE